MEKIKRIFSILNYTVENEDDLLNLNIDSNILKNQSLIQELYNCIPDFKKKYKSNALTCLHKNSLDKQKFPAVNFIRQILKCNNYKLEGYYVSLGYNKQNGKKILKRFYKITKLDNVPQSPKHLKPFVVKL